jgi:hypothetical protein
MEHIFKCNKKECDLRKRMMFDYVIKKIEEYHLMNCNEEFCDVCNDFMDKLSS